MEDIGGIGDIGETDKSEREVEKGTVGNMETSNRAIRGEGVLQQGGQGLGGTLRQVLEVQIVPTSVLFVSHFHHFCLVPLHFHFTLGNCFPGTLLVFILQVTIP